MTMRSLFLTLAAMLVLSTAPRAAMAQQGYVVIVNEANEVSEISTGDLSAMYLKKTRRWPNGQEVVPVDLSENQSTRESFSIAVHGKSTSAIKAYWQKMIFSGKAVPPVEKTVDQDVVAYVRATPGAIGYVSPGASVSGVRRVRVTQ
jgi:ABC-type phosphate transport system substrate-binding protein